ncbi:NtaA/DmoA family FMN-dependent monooxygenase [Nocardioides bruguierae]|uniref:NtaA/DmoA family FMN-dependent monooxygenase n=1 Tax=Nocardioides bruguierae TaxID=2945102 RepID=UPI002022963B|nr:NtaA/DmoA family FMN-dependent monooxygenase [Nocardioides bruguierae]MCL8025752.1 NtaA/DmoA family FMN-dependent monooxygenase [Nocardioides bruguierae]
MGAAPFHLGWFMSFRPPAWSSPWAGDSGRTWANGDYYIDFVRSLERAGFDYMMIEDSSMVSDAYAGSSQIDLKHALYAPKHDPVPLVPFLTAATERIGVVATMSTSFYPPFMLARTMTTLDHLSGGRVGWNIVTSSEDRAAQNYGMEKLFEHDERYDRADEFVDVVTKLWDSWEPGAIVMDQETGQYVDHTKIHPIEHEGQYFKVRGPMNTVRSPQGRPVFCQAGGSPRGRDFAAAHADTIIASAQGVEAMKAFRDDIRARMVEAGRKPDDCKILFVVMPTVAPTDAEALAIRESWKEPAVARMRAEAALGHLSALTENDFSTFDLDQPVPDVGTNGHRSTLADFLRMGTGGKTLREVASTWSIESFPFVGSPSTIASQMDEVMQEVGGDGFLISGAGTRRQITEICDGLVPELQARGLTRSSYTYEHFRDNLMEF